MPWLKGLYSIFKTYWMIEYFRSLLLSYIIDAHMADKKWGEILRHVAAWIRTAQVKPLLVLERILLLRRCVIKPHLFISTSVFFTLSYKFLGGHVSAALRILHRLQFSYLGLDFVKNSRGYGMVVSNHDEVCYQWKSGIAPLSLKWTRGPLEFIMKKASNSFICK